MIRQIVILTLCVGLCVSSAFGSVSATGSVTPHPSAWNSTTDVSIGNGTVTIDGGSDVESKVNYVAAYGSAIAEVTVTGDGSSWTMYHNGYIGEDGQATLNILDGGDVFGTIGILGLQSGSKGTAYVDGNGSVWSSTSIRVGNNGQGFLNVTNGGIVSCTNGTIGDQSSGYGEAVIDGSGSKWTHSSDLNVGFVGSGKLLIKNGGKVANIDGHVARSSGKTGDVTVTGPGSLWTTSRNLNVGYSGVGTLDIQAGGDAVNASGAVIGRNSSSAGSVRVRGSGSKLTNSAWLYVGFNGPGSLNIEDGGLVSTETAMTIDSDGNGDSYITMGTGGMLAVNGNGSASLAAFMGLISGTDDIRYFNESIWAWDDLSTATPGDDYTLSLISGGDLDGYTALTVLTVPEPATMFALAMGSLAVLRRRKHK